jgi:type I restriction enzyme R subunit
MNFWQMVCRVLKWRTIDGGEVATSSLPEMEVTLRGMFDKQRLLDIITNFIVFDTDGKTTFKILAAYHQYHAANKALTKTFDATAQAGDRRCGVVWHTQGSGKSLTMLFYAGKVIQALNNPTIVVLTDRNDLDEQLFGIFGRASDLLHQTPMQAANRSELKSLLSVASGGVVFTTIQKFFPESKDQKHPLLSDRKNIVVIADEAHRSQYGFKSSYNEKEDAFTQGFAQHMRDALPNASFIGFTGTPVELADANTRAVFGEYVDIYDIAQAVEDHATVPIYYEARLAKIELKESEKPKIDKDFEDLTEGEEVGRVEKLKSKWARLEAMVGAEKRIKLIAKDIVEHFENRLAVIDGKGMIVTMSRRIAVELYNEIIKLRPDWHSDKLNKGVLKVVMTGSASDPKEFQKHIPSKSQKDTLAKRMKNPKDELKLVIVRDMWLTGFDAPSMHTMYIDKPMRGHGLMQAIARVNRVYKDKQGGLVVDYIGIAPALKEALMNYTATGSGRPTVPQDEAVSFMLEKYEIVQGIFHAFDYTKFFTAKAAAKETLRAAAVDHILGLPDNGSKRFQKAVVELSHAFSLAVPHIEAIRIRDEVAFFQVIKAGLAKFEISTQGGPTEEDYDHAIRQIVSNAIVSNEVVDVFKAAGLKTPNVSVLSDEFLQEVQGMKYKNVALELLKRLLNDEIKVMAKKHLVKARSFLTMLIETIKRYQNKSIEAAQIIAELVNLAKQIREEREKGVNLGLTEDEVAFYDALCTNDSAIQELGDEALKKIAQELVVLLRKNTTIDWTMRESVQAKLRVYVKRLLSKHHYPPDKQDEATKIVLEQAEILCKDWSGSKEELPVV